MKFHIFRLNLSDRSRTRVGKEKEDEGELQWRKKALDEKFYTGTKKKDHAWLGRNQAQIMILRVLNDLPLTVKKVVNHLE